MAALYIGIEGSLEREVLPPRVREIMGVQHIKAFVFDDDVIITGANISSTYLSTRQDRYLIFRQTPQLASCVRHLLGAISVHSFQLVPLAGDAGRGTRREAATQLSPAPEPGSQVVLPVPLAEEEGPGEATQKLLSWRLHGTSPFLALGRRRDEEGATFALGDPPAGCHPVRTPARFRRSLRAALLAWSTPPGAEGRVLARSALLFERGSAGGTSRAAAPAQPPGDQKPAAPPTAHDTVLFPTVQAGFLGLVQDEAATLDALRCMAEAAPAGSLALSTPYLNLSRPLLGALSPPEALAVPGWFRGQASGLALALLTSSPEANGFWGSRGLSRHIPLAYATLEARVWRRLTGATAAGARLRARGFRLPPGRPSRGGAGLRAADAARIRAFHAKGLWFAARDRLAGDGPQATGAGSALVPRVAFSAVGSSNFGGRSQVRDLEAQFLLVTRNEALQRALGAEFRGLAAHAQAVSPDKLREPARRASPIVRGVVRLLKSFL
ncbi:hypothetical protein QBZ16_003505 [Prototheca wickerhamii]|uniref:CDP-diacylglycerol--glycerol-3-phosphate 3-phosphatidyltransferase n=1 Tax=Prototheca wickerhamii TaxID=3111 RepID=A0AAD9IL64_PROWI|nr:hypothetical protein QBZ16_003505 [Prototheca wickerhamii]